MQISIKGYITSKKSELFYDCADRYAYNISQNKFAISDGVSKSFFPKIWADILVNQWISKKWNSDDEFIEHCQKDWLEQVTEIVNMPDAKWFTKNAFNKRVPGLATFVGLRFYERRKEWFWKADALGDSFLFFVPEKSKDFFKECIVLSSKQEPIVFDNFPDYLSSLGNNHKGKKQSVEYPIASGTFYLMTDALAEWFLNEKENAINKIEVWQNQNDFERFVNEERLNEKLGNDDSAILTIKIEEAEKDLLIYALEEVSNINELVKTEQEEIEISGKAKEQEFTLQQEGINSEIPTEQIQRVEPMENKLSEETLNEIKKPKKGFIKRILGKEGNELSRQNKKTESGRSIEVTKENLEEKEPSDQSDEIDSDIQKCEDIGNGESQEIEPKLNEEPESNVKALNQFTKNITDKF